MGDMTEDLALGGLASTEVNRDNGSAARRVAHAP